MLRAVAFCTRACVKFKSSGTVYNNNNNNNNIALQYNKLDNGIGIQRIEQ